MFYVEINRPIHLKGDTQKLSAEIEQKFGVKPGIHLVEDGVIEGEKGKAPYWDYLPLFESIPTFKGYWNENYPIQEIDDRGFITIDLFLENGLLLQQDVTMELHQYIELSNKESGLYLLLCSIKGTYFQVIAS